MSEVLAQVLLRRGLAERDAAEAFLHPDYRVHNPYLLAGMSAARRRIDRALQRSEIIAVHGDYDADGITATFLLVRVLEDLGADVRWRLPNRFAEGYGVSAAAVDEFAAAGASLVITVDCGINARDEVARAIELGMDVIVTDHHELHGALPDCIVVSPDLGDYPCPHLAGVGVAFKLAHALLEEPREALVDVPLALRAYTDVVVVGTIADVVPLIGENRVLAAIGLGRLRSSPRPGLAALLEVAGGRPAAVDAGAVAYRLAPRLNAAGRLEDASLAMELLGCEDREAALPLALRLNELNRERQAIEAVMLAEATEMVPDPVPPALVLSSPTWHEGVVGIVAARVAERFYRPAILLAEGDVEAKGSGRSIPSFDLLAAVERSSDRLLAYGGHRAACGLRLRRDEVARFRGDFVREAAAALSDDDLRRVRHVDAIVGGGDLTLELADELELLAPHGFGNPQVALLLHGAEVATPRLTRDRRHLHYRLRSDGTSCPAIHFGCSDLQGVAVPGRHDVVLELGKNDYDGTVSAQVRVRSLQRLETPATDLCPTPCDLTCRERLSGAALWRAWLGVAPSRGVADAAALRAARNEGRLLDRRGRPAIPALADLLASGERVLVLVADVARRRPLLSRDLVAPGLARSGLYVQGACMERLAAAMDAADVVMTGYDVLAAHPELGQRFAQVALVDPPFTAALWASVAAAAPHAWVHALWGAADAAFAAQVREAHLGLDPVMRRVWRALDAGERRFGESLEQVLLESGTFLASVTAVGAAIAVLREAALLVVDEEGGFHLQRPQSKVDVTATDTYREWHTRFETPDYLRTCLTAPL